MNSIAKPYRLPVVILVAGSLSVILGMGLRASLGLYLKPMSIDLGWGREIFAFAMALQNLLWGFFQPFAASIAEKFGTGRVVAVGGVLYASGLYLMADVENPLELHISAGLLIGMAQSGCALAVILGAVGRALPDEKRTLGLGLVTGFGAGGQVIVVPIGQVFLSQYGWSTSFALLALMALAILVCAYFLRDNRSGQTTVTGASDDQLDLKPQLRLAAGDRSFWLLTAGFFVCGFHVAFIGVHLPAFLSDAGLPPETGAWSLSLIGLFNILGSFSAGFLGDKFPKKYLLSTLYTLRAVAIILFISFPITIGSVIVFSVAMGFLWLSTVPLTSGLVAVMFGTRFMGTLFSIVFMSHQVGSFLGVWLGGLLYDEYGSYDAIWWAGIIIGLLSAALHLPIHERAVPQPANA